ncbi:MAG: excinuclease ABC subunit UvrC [Sphingomonadaceae bacterium]|uniref:excinuclease ABC subunit UvrC n=1 Tax=Thermaurantiacus sp. TaxID=2820283 RepID=UPI00298EE0E8|nr:excinuclease ABC subunit UvrC [Thermaurantiacus sp.]MCS6985903.1 excinuclease ABC subunit UvrC [Sphingomonadaceae bacterium]MDW8414881.1 excinuclease ABC subunit UvrC [Thermaurantiacus sp.]
MASAMGATADRPDWPEATDRFDERGAAQVLARGRPDLEAGVAAIRETLATLGREPGVYRMVDAAGDVLYVGKARALRNRVATYTQVERLPRRLQRMVALTRGLVVVTTRSEAEALLLEAQLIKRYRPPFNVVLRDDKSFPFIALDLRHPFPRLAKHRGARRDGVVYYGPFASAGAVAATLNALQKLFLLRSCTDSFMERRTRPCLLFQIRRCSAPCVGRIDARSYAGLVADARAFLAGKSGAVQERLKQAMAEASAELDFERAAILRDRLKALAHVQGAQAIHANDARLDADVIAVARDQGLTGIQVFFLRSGQNWGHRALFPAHAGDVDEGEVLAAFLGQFYAEVDPPPLVLLDRAPPDPDLLAEALSARAGRRVELKVPQRGRLRALVDQARRNAAEAVARRLAERGTQLALFARLAEVFGLPEPPRRIEIYDNSHVMGTNALGAMVVATPEGFLKGAYRRFGMRTGDVTPGDDPGMVRAMLTRRFRRALEEDPGRRSDWPDLLLIDGGRTQVAAATAVLEELGIDDVAVVGIAKGPDRNAGRETFHLTDGRSLTLPPGDALLFLLQRLRDEAHRFAIGGHRARRGRAMVASTLDEVPGVGPARKKALLMHFGTARAVKGASLEDLCRVPGISRGLAETIWRHFHAPGTAGASLKEGG